LLINYWCDEGPRQITLFNEVWLVMIIHYFCAQLQNSDLFEQGRWWQLFSGIWMEWFWLTRTLEQRIFSQQKLTSWIKGYSLKQLYQSRSSVMQVIAKITEILLPPAWENDG
jgi:hypothetical protein